jgi:hypothetical protein
MHVIMMDLFELWWLNIKYIYIYINYVKKILPYALGILLDFNMIWHPS